MNFLKSNCIPAFFLSIFLLVACQVQEAEPANARIAIIHAVPGAPSLDIVVNGNLLAVSPVSYPDSTDYVTLRAGLLDFQLAPTGSPELGNPVSIPFTEGRTYSLFLLPRSEGIELLRLEDNLALPPAGKVRLRFVNASPDATALKLGTTADTVTILTGKELGSVASTDDFAPTTYTFRLRVDTTLIPGAALARELRTGKFYTIYAHGYLNPPPGSTDSLALSIMQNF